MINITSNFLNRILELFNMVSAPSMSSILKLAVLMIIDILTVLSKQMNKLTSVYLERSLIKNKCVNV
jgi:hypothetical protein